ncbi:MAG: DUF1501 domain-containing protein [Pseudomonadota bacterium]
MDRRHFLTRIGALGCTAAASPLVTPIALASGPWDHRLVVIILRGAMDGLDVVRPVGDPEYAGLRGTLTDGNAPFGTGFYQFHPALAPLSQLWAEGSFGAIHAVSTPYRDQRSHFDGQDILEAGTMGLTERQRDGWLNRMLQAVPGLTAETAYAIGQEQMLILAGDAPAARWSPDARLNLSDQARRLLEIVVHDDPLFQAAMGQAIEITDQLKQDAEDIAEVTETMMDDSMVSGVREGNHTKVAEFAVTRLRAESRIASFSIGGWDTHQNQHQQLPRTLSRLTDTILMLRAGLGPVWDKTAILCMTEFGRTVRENGTRGTDHGTGGALLYAGGALRGGQVTGQWPGLTEADLYARRDLMPVGDVRAVAGHVLQGLFGFDRGVIERVVFPGLQMETPPQIVL